MKQGFTLIMAVIAIIIVVVIGNTETEKCQSGYKFIKGRGHYTQVLDEHGHGIPCEKK